MYYVLQTANEIESDIVISGGLASGSVRGGTSCRYQENLTHIIAWRQGVPEIAIVALQGFLIALKISWQPTYQDEIL